MTDEIRKAIEERVLDNLRFAIEFDAASAGRKQLDTETSNLIDKLLAVDERDAEIWDKQERRRIEEERNKTTAEIEQNKLDVNWKRMVLEGAKIVVPMLTTVISLACYDRYQKRVMEYEKDGTIRTTAGRQLGLPRILK